MIHSLTAICVFLWAGMLLGISFFESWIKFKTPGLNKTVGLNVGRTVFLYFQRVQIVWLIFLIFLIFLQKANWMEVVLSTVLALTLIVQNYWIFPILSQRVDVLVNGEKPPHTYAHSLYGIGELIKFVTLLVLGVNNLN